jgi:bla regulator protein BlaR1
MELLIYIGKAATILSIFYLVYIAVLRKDTLFTANRHFLLSGILAAITFPFIEITRRIIVEIPTANEIIYNDFLPIEQMPIQETVSVNWWQVAFFIYMLGVCFMLLRFMKQLLSLGLLLYKYPSVKKAGYRYIITSENTPPFSFFRNIVYNPELHAQQELEMILKHEEVHASQWHSVDIIAANLLLIFQWINPLAWFYKKGVEENLEYIADSATVQQIESVKQYQLALVKASSTSPIPALTNNFYQSFIKKRIVMLNKSTSKKINAWKLMLVLPLLAVFLWSFNINEVVTYTDSNSSVPDIISPYATADGIEVASENKLRNDSKEISDKTPREAIPEYEENPMIDEAIAMVQENNQATISEIIVKDDIITITKNTTKKELDAMKSNLKSTGVSFDYSDLVYNKSNEIIGISIKYKSKDGNSGSYSVNSDTPINTVVIKTNGDRVSVQSKGSRSYSYSSEEGEEEMRARTQEQQQRLEMHREEMEKRREEMKERQGAMELRQVVMVERQAEMEVRRTEMQNEMEERRVEMHERQREVHEREMNEHRNVLIMEGNGSNMHRTHVIEDSDGTIYEIQDTHGGSGDVIIVDRIGENGHTERQYNTLYSSHLIRISKKSTKADLEKLKNEFKAKGISFSYNGVKRNDAGEITKIKLKVKDNKGSSSSSSYNGEGKTIDTILIDTSNGITIMKGGSH